VFTVVLIYHKVYIIGAEKGLMVKGTVFFFPIIYKGTSIAGFLNTRRLGVDPKANPSFFGRLRQQLAGTYVYTWMERGSGGIKCLNSDYNTTAKVEFSPLRYPKDKHTLEAEKYS